MRVTASVVVFATALSAAASLAQTPPAKPAAPAAKPRPAAAPIRTRTAPDLKTAVYYASDALGMLRSPREVDMVLTMELWGTGSLTVDGKPCKLANMKTSVRYRPVDGSPHNDRMLPVPAMRMDFACAGANGRPGPRQINVLAGPYAWNEDKPGVGGTPMPQAAAERQHRVWTLIPESLMKAAVLAGAKTTLAEEGGKPTLTFPMPAPLEAATMKVTLNPAIFRVDTNPAGVKREFSHLPEKSELRVGGSVIETTYSNYSDLNDEDLQSMILIPRRIVQRKDGNVVADLSITRTDTFNPYVIMPVPDSVRKATASQTAQSR